MTEYIDRTISILEDATKHLSDGNNMLCAMAIGRAIATLDVQKNKSADASSTSQLIHTEDPVPIPSLHYNTTKNIQYAYTPSITCETVSNNSAGNAVVKDATIAVDEGLDDLSNITIDDLKEYSKMKKLMASMEVIDAMKGRISGFCSKISEGMKTRFQNKRMPSYKPFYYTFIIHSL